MNYRGVGLTLLVLAVVLAFVSYGSAQGQTKSFSNSSSKRGWLGVEIKDVTKRLKEQENLTVSEGAYVTNVVEDSPAEEAGIKEGDVIVNVDGKTIEDGDDLTNVVRRIKPKTEVKVEFVRGSDKKTVTAKIGKTSGAQTFAYGFGNGMRMMTPPAFHTPPMPRLPKMHGGNFFFSDEANGLELQSLSKQLAEYFEVPDREGMLIANVEKGSSAEKAGFKAGDVLTKVEGEPIRDLDDLHDALRDTEGKDVKCDLIRKGKSVTLTWHIERDAGGDDESDYDGEGDMSYESFAPRWNVHVAPFHLKSPGPSLRQFKEEMKDFKRELKEKLKDIRREIRSELFNVD